MPEGRQRRGRYLFWMGLLAITLMAWVVRSDRGMQLHPDLGDVSPDKLPIYEVLVQAVMEIEQHDKAGFVALYRPGPKGGMRNALNGWDQKIWHWRQKAQGIRDQLLQGGHIDYVDEDTSQAVFPYTYREFKRLKHARVLFVRSSDGWHIQDLNY